MVFNALMLHCCLGGSPITKPSIMQIIRLRGRANVLWGGDEESLPHFNRNGPCIAAIYSVSKDPNTANALGQDTTSLPSESF
jgi:hypothetical protein